MGWPTLPRRGTESEVGGMISARRRKNTVRESRMEMERDTYKRFKRIQKFRFLNVYWNKMHCNEWEEDAWEWTRAKVNSQVVNETLIFFQELSLQWTAAEFLLWEFWVNWKFSSLVKSWKVEKEIWNHEGRKFTSFQLSLMATTMGQYYSWEAFFIFFYG